MAFEAILAAVTASAGKVDVLGKTLKLDFGDQKIFIDGSGASNLVSTEDKDADCVVSISQDDLIAISNGALNPMMAFMSGKIKVKGDMGVAMKLQSLFK